MMAGDRSDTSPSAGRDQRGHADSGTVPAIPRPAASMILVRQGPDGPEALMGIRGRKAAFMPKKLVFPGGSVEPRDSALPVRDSLSANCLRRLALETDAPHLSVPLALAAIRETYEETGLALGEEGGPPPGGLEGSWAQFHALGIQPALARLRFVFRAITPVSLPMRFDARFFLASAKDVHGGEEAAISGSGELEDLDWVSMRNADGRADLPRVTRRVLREVLAVFEEGDEDRPVPYYEGGSGEAPQYLH